MLSLLVKMIWVKVMSGQLGKRFVDLMESRMDKLMGHVQAAWDGDIDRDDGPDALVGVYFRLWDKEESEEEEQAEAEQSGQVRGGGHAIAVVAGVCRLERNHIVDHSTICIQCSLLPCACLLLNNR